MTERSEPYNQYLKGDVMKRTAWNVYEGGKVRTVRTLYKPWYGLDAVVLRAKAKR